MVDFNDDIAKLEQKAKEEGWDKKAEEEIKQRIEKNNQPKNPQQ